MQETFIFLTAFMILLAGLLCIYKKEEKVSFFRSAVVCLITELCIGTVLAGVCDLLKLPVGLLSMGAGFFVIACVVWGIILYQRRIQPMKADVIDIYAFIVLTIFFIILFLKIFNVNIQLVYTNTDPARHYSMAKNVMETQTLGRMYFAALYNGLFMKLCQPFLAEISLYKAFILSDAFFQYLNLLMFYVILMTVLKSKILKLLSPFVCMFYFLGWPLYSFVIGGFVYYGDGVMLCAYVVYLLSCLEDAGNPKQKKGIYGLVALGIFSLAVCYMLFVPAICLIVLVGVWHMLRERKFAVSRKTFVLLGVGVTAFLVIIFCVCFFGFFKGDLSKVFAGLQNEGGVHKQLYEDLLLLIPPTIYMSMQWYKKKEWNWICVSAVSTGGIVVCFFILCLLGVVSGYYYYKWYYLLWLLFWLMCAEAMEYFWKENRGIFYACGVPVAAALVLEWIGVLPSLASGSLVNANTQSMFPIYEVTRQCVQAPNMEDLAGKDALIDMIGYMQENLQEESEEAILFVAHEKNYISAWYGALNGGSSREVFQETLKDELEQLEKEESVYFLIQKTTSYYYGNEEMLEKYPMLYDNGYYGLYKSN